MKQWITRALLLCCLWGLVVSAWGAESPERRLEALQRSQQSLRADPERRAFRHHWENLIHKLEKLVAPPPAPDPRLDARVRYTLGTAWRDLYDQSRVKSDLEPAAEIFSECVRLYPDSPLADDALYQLGEIQAKLRRPQARETLLRILRDYPDGNRIDEAQFLLNGLQQPANGVLNTSDGTVARAQEEAAPAEPEVPSTAAQLEPSPPVAMSGTPSTAAQLEASPPITNPESSSTAAQLEVSLPITNPESSPTVAQLEASPAVSELDVAAPVAELEAIKVWTNPDYTRLVLHMTGKATFAQLLMPPATEDAGTSTLLLELPGTMLSPEFERTLIPAGEDLEVPVSGGLLDGAVVRHRPQGGVTVRLALQNLKTYRVTPFSDPDRILVDLFGEAQAPEEEDPLEALVMTLPSGSAKSGKGGGTKAPRYTIVIDAGHGGHDPGALGPTGALEKDVTLAIALKVKKKVSTLPGVRVIMTREKDIFVPLENRAAVANKHKADLFISIHANASPKEENRGLETYYLDTASDEGAEKLAERENAMLGTASDLAFILQDLVIEGNVRYSRRLAQSVHQSVLTTLRQKYPAKTVRDLGVKSALFYVLFSAQMPSILVETAFISNGLEETRLTNTAYQNQVADAIKAGVKRYTEETRALSRAGE